MSSAFQIRQAAHLLRAGGVIAHPTEGVYGLACNPANDMAVARLLAIKARPADKGLILLADTFDKLEPWLAPLPAAMRDAALASWPGPVTWLLPVASHVPPLLTGGRSTLAVRVSAHPVAAGLSRAFDGALVSTSANLSGRPAALSAQAVRLQLGSRIDGLLSGPLTRPGQPSRIIDGASGKVLRA